MKKQNKVLLLFVFSLLMQPVSLSSQQYGVYADSMQEFNELFEDIDRDIKRADVLSKKQLDELVLDMRDILDEESDYLEQSHTDTIYDYLLQRSIAFGKCETLKNVLDHLQNNFERAKHDSLTRDNVVHLLSRALFAAVASAKVDILEPLLEFTPSYDLDVNTRFHGKTLLHELAQVNVAGNVLKRDITKVAKFLLARGADAQLRDSDDRLPLFYAIIHGNQVYAQLLIKQMPSKILKQAVDFRSGDTLLHDAAWNGLLDVVIDLINKGLEVGAVNARGKTPLHHAIINGQNDVFEYLVYHYCFLPKGKKLDINMTDFEENNLLHEAALALGNYDLRLSQRIMNILFASGVDVNGLNEGNLTPLNLVVDLVNDALESGKDEDLVDTLEALYAVTPGLRMYGAHVAIDKEKEDDPDGDMISDFNRFRKRLYKKKDLFEQRGKVLGVTVKTMVTKIADLLRKAENFVATEKIVDQQREALRKSFIRSMVSKRRSGPQSSQKSLMPTEVRVQRVKMRQQRAMQMKQTLDDSVQRQEMRAPKKYQERMPPPRPAPQDTYQPPRVVLAKPAQPRPRPEGPAQAPQPVRATMLSRWQSKKKDMKVPSAQRWSGRQTGGSRQEDGRWRYGRRER
ncbi:MAG: ankyrin repeat domain-containing protein [Epsilonproteobacteria bacterium]|nr:ankyrin repeat domain-containing protein [Campylobacterota bacterium]